MRFLFALIVLPALSAAVAAGEPAMVVTAVRAAGGGADVTLNNVLLIRGVQLGGRSRARLELPALAAPGGARLREVGIRSPRTYLNVRRAVGRLAAAPGKSGPITFALERLDLIPRSSRRANALISFNDDVTVWLGVVMDRETGGYRVAYPARRGDADEDYTDAVEILNGELKDKVEKAVLHRFARTLSEKGQLKAARRARLSMESEEVLE